MGIHAKMLHNPVRTVNCDAALRISVLTLTLAAVVNDWRKYELVLVNSCSGCSLYIVFSGL